MKKIIDFILGTSFLWMPIAGCIIFNLITKGW